MAPRYKSEVEFLVKDESPSNDMHINPSSPISSTSQEYDDDSNGSQTKRRHNIKLRAAHKDAEYIRGSIVHLSLRSFVTYDRIDISPGPHFNMIIGPNGTGKSTIVCAIALGLGEKPSLLGRAKDISEYVKHGHEKGSIEITLSGGNGRPSAKIRREITRSNNSSLWKLNGRQVSFSEIQKVTASMKIQVNNLCQFLPQDRVVEFSAMSPQRLLKEAQRAVGREDLCDMQNELISKRAEERNLMTSITQMRIDSAALQKQNESLERDVQRWRQRQEVESQVRVLTALIPVMRYTDAKNRHDSTKELRKRARAQYIQAKNDAGPAEDEIQNLEQKIANCERMRRKYIEDISVHENRAQREVTNIEQLERQQKELYDEFEDIGRRAMRRREAIRKLRQDINDMEQAHSEEPPDDDTASLREEANKIRTQQQSLSADVSVVQEQQTELMQQCRQLNRDIEIRSTKLHRLDDATMRRRETLRKFNPDSYKALEWLEQNRSLFREHVFAPICLEATVSDPRYAALVESVVSAGTLRTFVVQCAEDYHKFTREVNDTLRLRVNVVYCNKPLASFKPPQPSSSLQSYGFAGYMLDFIEAPQPVLAAICDRDHIHSIPLSLRRVDNARVEESKIFREYIAQGIRYTISRGRYGSNSSTIVTSRIRTQARLLTSGETEEVRALRGRLESEINEMRDQLTSNEDQTRQLQTNERRIRDSHRELEVKEQQVREEIKQIKAVRNKWETERVKIETARARLATMISDERRDGREGNQQSRAEQEGNEVKRRMKENASQRTAAIVKIAEHIEEADTKSHSAAAAIIEAHKHTSALIAVHAQIEQHRESLREAERALEDADQAFSEAKQFAKQCLEETREVTDKMSDDERQLVRAAQNERKDKTWEEVEVELTVCKQRLNLATNTGISERIIELYETRSKQLKEMIETQKRVEHDAAKLRKKKHRIREKWEPVVVKLIENINREFTQMFESIGCVGQVQLKRAGDGIVYQKETQITNGEDSSIQLETRKRRRQHSSDGSQSDGDDNEKGDLITSDDEDYTNWGIEILVSFRQDEPMKALTNHRQSGGERAVSTILFLQSLQAMVSVPFRVVDEINQGMDQRNERLVHQQIVNTACREDTSQYFLITPKLLPDLVYHPLMTVLCIYNGEWQPDQFDVGKYINAAKSKR